MSIMAGIGMNLKGQILSITTWKVYGIHEDSEAQRKTSFTESGASMQVQTGGL